MVVCIFHYNYKRNNQISFCLHVNNRIPLALSKYKTIRYAENLRNVFWKGQDGLPLWSILVYEKLGVIIEKGGIKMYSKVQNDKNYKSNCR
jgi:hypothetical protein